jgi:hypothetical protein
MRKIVLPVILAASSLFSGCATITGEETQTIPISSTPRAASVLIIDEKGMEVFSGLTPTSVTLNKSDGSYWGKKSFTVNITKDGYQSQVIPISAHANGWYIGGNFFFGGVIGWFIIDPMNGAMYTLSPDQIQTSFAENAAHNNRMSDGSISVMLVEEVPLALRPKMTRVN